MAIGKNSPHFSLWVALVRAHQRVGDAIDAAFKAAGLPCLEWYDILLELERKADPVRARDLEQELLVAQYNLSRLLDRLERDGLVARLPDPDDGRSRLICLTGKGRDMRRRMWPVYRDAIGLAIGTRLGDEEAAELSTALRRLYTPT